jgi:hypothetical protein
LIEGRAAVIRFAIAAALMPFASSGFAAGVDPRAYSCGALQGLVAANRFIFINTPGFDDFVVADASSCSGSEIIQRRSVPTTDTAECVVNYCKNRGGGVGN